MKNRFLAVLALAATMAAAGCGSSSPSSPSSPDQSNVAYSQTDLVVGTGATATAGRTANVNYTLWLYSESATDHKGTQMQTGTYAFVVGGAGVIAGWNQGVPGMQVGGKRRLILPPSLGYGSSGNGSIPPNAALVFDLELLSVQ